MFGGASLSARLVPLVAAFPWVLDHQARALFWAELLLAEDPTSPDVLELVAVIWGRAGRFGGTERMLMELVYHSPDRAAGIARGAAVWERLGRPREACAQWIRAARWRDDPEDPVWRKAYACARRDPGAGDAKAIRDYVISRARPERRDVLAVELEGRPAAVDGGTAAAVDGGAEPDAGRGAATAAGTSAAPGRYARVASATRAAASPDRPTTTSTTSRTNDDARRPDAGNPELSGSGLPLGGATFLSPTPNSAKSRWHVDDRGSWTCRFRPPGEDVAWERAENQMPGGRVCGTSRDR